MFRRCLRWRAAAFSLLLLVVGLNLFVFFTLPTSSHRHKLADDHGFPGPQRHDSRAISHLQFPRKRLNKSNFTSESLGADGGGGAGGGGRKRGGGGGGAAWEEGVGDHPPLRLQGHGQKLGTQNRDSNATPQTRKERLSRVKGSVGGQSGQDGKDAGLHSSNLTDPVVDDLLTALGQNGLLDLPPGGKLENEDYWAFLKRQRLRRKGGIQLSAYKNYKASTNWERFHQGIHQHYLYNPDDPAIEDLLKDLTQREIVDVEQKEGGTQIKLIITLDDEGQSLFKPMRYPRDRGTLPDHFYFADYERHVSEIAAFHLDRALGFNRVPPVAGRVFNITTEIRRHVDGKLGRTFFMSPAGNLCFHGSCSYYCDSGHPICGHPDMLEASLMAFLPPEKMAHRQTWRNPWKRSYSKHRKAYWEVYDDLCEKVQKRSPYNSGRRLLDIIDMSVLDFLMGNLDRHHYETFRNFGNNSFIIHLDHGRGFGKSHEDDMSCLAPMIQCCMIRLSTLQRLVRFYKGPNPLSSVMRLSLSKDKVNPVLIEPHLQALDRRLVKILKAIAMCTWEDGQDLQATIIDDGVY